MGLKITPRKNLMIDIDDLAYAMKIAFFVELNVEEGLFENFTVYHMILK